MPLDTSSYSLALLRLDGRRWNDLRRLHAQVSTQAAADGSSYLEMGNTKVICTVQGPFEASKMGMAGSSANSALLQVDIAFAGFSGLERKRRGRGDKHISELQQIIVDSLTANILTTLYPRSSINMTLHVLSQDGSILAALLNASTLALIDAGIPMKSYLCACTVGHTTSSSGNSQSENDISDPILDLNSLEEQELPFMTIATVSGEAGDEDKLSVCQMETRLRMERLEEMLAVGVDGCKRVRELLDVVIRAHGRKLLQKAAG
ncbi:ribosomal protein S5 domain 2-like protein [Pseudovirgaria hyperparasitica]|uniref:Ribosomal RNA-processing protein 41 n=1 Tax=Pseudovirgaria hyperparasitica TaxID=470096 RepID=A0A6A6VZG2_9PEZI|nr:ribosomal protein S5 domain 2-like protein [Pseudovirgaria hyperparasitica]KAF2755269.1 ribosomal protein S5 domain 2-like protein [Pseudovirgaria hyperparasitica]